MPKVSVVVPVYNTEKYMRRCLESILYQTYTDLEVILVDDGSTDKSGEICDEYAQKDTRVKVIHKKKKELLKQELMASKFLLVNIFHLLMLTIICRTVFSIIFNKQFNVLPIRGKKDYRVSSLLSTFDLSDRMIVDGKCSNNEIEKWCSINEKLATIKKESIAYLTANII